jgi:hypothetical protein
VSEVGRELTAQELAQMGNPEELNEVPLDKCLNNAFEPNEGPVVNSDGEEVEVENYIHYPGMDFGHPFMARRKPDGLLELLGSNAVLASARKQGIQTIQTVIVHDKTDEQWLLMSIFSGPFNVWRGYHMWKVNKSINSATFTECVEKWWSKRPQVHSALSPVEPLVICNWLELYQGAGAQIIAPHKIDDEFFKQLIHDNGAYGSWAAAHTVMSDINLRIERKNWGR